MRLYDFPIAPVILGAILGPNLENQIRRALTASNGDWSVFVTQPTSAIILALAVVAFVVPTCRGSSNASKARRHGVQSNSQ